MLSTKHRFIYLHVSKTAGNSVQELILPFSDDRKEVTLFRDGIERYDVVGPVTPHKHARLGDYWARMGSDIDGYFIFASVRQPASRAVSYYFSPHRWARQSADGSWYFADPVWDPDAFVAMLPEVAPVVEYFTVEGAVRPYSDVIRMESLEADFRRIVKRVGLPIDGSLPHRNKTMGRSELVERALADKAIMRRAEEHFAADMAYLGY